MICKNRQAYKSERNSGIKHIIISQEGHLVRKLEGLCHNIYEEGALQLNQTWEICAEI